MSAKNRTPDRLGAKARKIWAETTETFELSAVELRVLEDACREVDLIERLEKALDKSPLMVTGSMGQLVASPLVQELRQHRATVTRLFAALKLPDDPGEVGEGDGSRGPSARAAANARWGRSA